MASIPEECILMKVRIVRIAVFVGALAVVSATTVQAQTVPPGGAAPVPILPQSSTPPPDTNVPGALADIPVVPVSFSYFGPYAVVDELAVPPLITAAGPVGCWSAPNADGDQNVGGGAVDFGTKPAGTQFIAFFARGTRLYVFDTSGGNYCWVDNQVSRS